MHFSYKCTFVNMDWLSVLCIIMLHLFVKKLKYPTFRAVVKKRRNLLVLVDFWIVCAGYAAAHAAAHAAAVEVLRTCRCSQRSLPAAHTGGQTTPKECFSTALIAGKRVCATAC